MARDFRLQGDARCETCHLLLRHTPFQTNHGARQIASDELGRAECYTFGAYAHGNFAGVTNATNRHQELVRYINFFIQTREKSLRWSSLAINNNNPLTTHKDVHNLKGELNVLICVGSYVGGGLWLEMVSGNRDTGTSLRKVGSRMLPGRIHDCHDKIMVFDPGLYHGPEPWRGDRWSINAYTSRGFVHLGQHQTDQLRSLKFPIGRSSPGMLAHTVRVSFEDGEEIGAEAAYPTEEAEKRKAKLKAGHVIKPKKFVVEQSNDDLGDDLSSIMEHTDCVSWTPELSGARSENISQSDEFESSLLSFLVGKYRWMHGSSMQAPMSRLRHRGVFSMEQFAASQDPIGDDFVEVMEIFGGDVTTAWIISKKHGVKTGWNLDLTIGINLHNPRDVNLLWQYLETKRPQVILLSPACRRSGSKCNNDNYLVGLAAQIAAFQMDCGNHFVAEQPDDRNMFGSPHWARHMKGRTVYQTTFDQGMLGLIDRKSGLPIRKPTQLVSSSDVIIRRFADLKRKCAPQTSAAVSHKKRFSVSICGHESLASKGCDMKVWSSAFCDLLAQGIVECLMQPERGQAMFPTVEKVKCPGCRWHKRKDHPSHDRSEHCKFPDVAVSKWTCAGCVKNKPRGDKTHTLDENCQWNLARVMPEGLGRERKGGHPRDVRVPTAAEPTASLNESRIRAVGSREMHPEDAEALRAAAERAQRDKDVQPLRVRRANPSSSINAGPGRRDAEAQASDPGVGVNARLRDPAESREGAPALGEGVDDGAPAAGEAADEDRWTSFDLGRALIDLRSVREGVVRRALRKLHIRWFHASAQKMKTLLTAAGVPQDIMLLVQQIVDTCDICRNWSKPGPRTITSSTITTRFNQEIQVDLLFFKDKVVLHMIDRTTRFTVARRIVSKHLDSVLEGVVSHWISMFGPPCKITSDQEGAFSSPEAAAALEARGIKLHLLAKEQHASIVERHHAILRRQLHVLDEQATAEGLKVSFDALLADAVFAKNALFSMGGSSPFEAVFGRTPPLLGVVDAEAGDNPDDRDCDRLRQLAIDSMVQATAENKMRRADRGKTRMPGELLDLKVGDAVEFYRKASTKDAHSWFGPATVTDLTSVLDGQIGIKWQGRLMLCRVQDVRRALLFWCFMTMLPADSPVAYLCAAAEDARGDSIRLGWFRSKESWLACEANKRFPRVLLAGLHVGSCALNLSGVVSFRYGSCLQSLPAVACDDSFVLWWRHGHHDVWHHAYLPGTQHINVAKLAGTCDVALVQFFCVDSEIVASLRQVVHDVPNLGGPFDPTLPTLEDVTAEVSCRRQRRQLALEDAAAQSSPQRFDIYTPPVSNSDLASDSNMESEPEDFESAQSMFAHFAVHPPTVLVTEAFEDVFVFTTDELSTSGPEIAFSSAVTKYLVTCKVPVQVGDLLVFNVGSDDAVIERTHNVLSRQEALANADECRKSMLKELARWHNHKAWARTPREQCNNILTSKWVLKWKQIEGSKQVKARMVVQGFKDLQEVKSFAGTTTRWAQRLVIAIAVQFSWPIYSADVSEAFLRGLSFRELHASGEDAVLRSVQLELPAGSVELLRTLPGMSDFDPQVECLNMLKPGFGLKDAPRLWNKALKRVLAEIGLVAIKVDEQLYVKHDSQSVLVLILSVHVDDLKLAGVDAEVKRTLKILEHHFDQLKLDRDNFEHLGLKHTLSADGSRSVSQAHYVSELKPIPDKDLKLQDPKTPVDDSVHDKFRSLLGGVAWVTQTRPDVAVFVSALQRKMKAPTAGDVINLNRVLKYLKVKPLDVVYKKLEGPWAIIAISDSSFKGEDQEHTAVRSGIIALTSRAGPCVGVNKLQVLEYVSKKQSKVCRSTYAAELHSALDLMGLATIINSAMTEILTGPKTAVELARIQDSGENALKLFLILDAKSVVSGAVSEEPKCTDQSVFLHLLKLREFLGPIIHALGWVDTRDMVADGLNKGIISRDALRTLAQTGEWHVSHQPEIHVQRSGKV